MVSPASALVTLPSRASRHSDPAPGLLSCALLPTKKRPRGSHLPSFMIAGDDPLTADVIGAAPDLKVIIRWGIGMDSVDHAAAAAAGVVVRNTPAVFGDEVADCAFGYVLLLARGHHAVDAAVRAGEWPKVEGISLAGQRLGVVGLGSIGRAIARRGNGFAMDVVAHDPYADPALSVESGVQLLDLDELLRTSRFVVLASPLTPETHHMALSPFTCRTDTGGTTGRWTGR